MFSKGVEFTFEFDPSDDEVRRTIRDSRCMLKCDACGDAAVVAAARALAAAYDAALAAEVRADARARDAALAEGAWFWRSFCATYGAAPAPAPLYLFVRPSRVRDPPRPSPPPPPPRAPPPPRPGFFWAPPRRRGWPRAGAGGRRRGAGRRDMC